jgi:hypothetical protein
MIMKAMLYLFALSVSGICQAEPLAQFPPLQTQAAVLIESLSENGTNTGSGFFVRHSNHLFFVTARHVLFQDAKVPKLVLFSTNCLLTYGNNTGDPQSHRIKVNIGQAFAMNELRAHPSLSRDVAAIHLYTSDTNNIMTPSPFVTGGTQEDFNWLRMFMEQFYPPTGIKFMTNVAVGSTVYTFGYPSSISFRDGHQLDRYRPLCRRGAVADVDPIRRVIVLDLAVYGGNSGGIVIEESRPDIGNQIQILFSPIGLVTQFVPFVEEWKNSQYQYANTTVANTGYAICEPMDSVFELLW